MSDLLSAAPFGVPTCQENDTVNLMTLLLCALLRSMTQISQLVPHTRSRRRSCREISFVIPRGSARSAWMPSRWVFELQQQQLARCLGLASAMGQGNSSRKVCGQTHRNPRLQKWTWKRMSSIVTFHNHIDRYRALYRCWVPGSLDHLHWTVRWRKEIQHTSNI